MHRKQVEAKKYGTNNQLANELSIMKRLHNISIRFVSDDRSQDLLAEIVETAVVITDADMGNIQLFDAQSGSLKIVAHSGFKQPFLDFFSTVYQGQAACGEAMECKERVIIEDVTQSPIFMGTPSLEVMLAAGARAVQSTPLFSRSGRLVGMLSTHYQTPRRPDEQDLQLLDLLARLSADIIEREQKEQEIKRREQEYRTLVENCPFGLTRFDTDLRHIYFNQACYSFWGETIKLLLGKTWEEAGTPREHYHPMELALNKVLETGHEQVFDTEYLDQRGQIRYYRNRAVAEANNSGIVDTLLVISQDITAQKKSEIEIQRLDRLNLVGEMAASIGHEVRNPLTTVKGYLQLFQMKEQFAGYSSQLDMMIQELDRANAIITEFLSLAKNKTVELQPGSLNDTIYSIIPLLQAEALHLGHQIFVITGDIPTTYFSDKEIRQLILNLVKNALEAMKHNGTISIKTYQLNDEIVLAIEDSGAGIPNELLDKLGTPFLTTKECGTGLGLPVCYRIAERHMAKIEIDTSSKGTTFFIKFPIRTKQL
ncbi:hypothetical protein AXX12_12555 [Anaerosporomusa subterranea]|uniref:histidine kinase n=1 Tax=Anaerosporomusa subterranea TaxID=1794912 RepID=A0A154BPW0_ANASB|nr:ATP-binding protein [Anaerosporomusa subterranea]KYZ75538.1 hypothetical protein AXX12_12555 [Anaerosporomusa subterranea]